MVLIPSEKLVHTLQLSSMGIFFDKQSTGPSQDRFIVFKTTVYVIRLLQHGTPIKGLLTFEMIDGVSVLCFSLIVTDAKDAPLIYVRTIASDVVFDISNLLTQQKIILYLLDETNRNAVTLTLNPIINMEWFDVFQSKLYDYSQQNISIEKMSPLISRANATVINNPNNLDFDVHHANKLSIDFKVIDLHTPVYHYLTDDVSNNRKHFSSLNYNVPNNNRKDGVLQEWNIEDAIAPIFPRASIFPSHHYIDTEKKERELDIVIVVDDYILIIELKSLEAQPFDPTSDTFTKRTSQDKRINRHLLKGLSQVSDALQGWSTSKLRLKNQFLSLDPATVAHKQFFGIVVLSELPQRFTKNAGIIPDNIHVFDSTTFRELVTFFSNHTDLGHYLDFRSQVFAHKQEIAPNQIKSMQRSHEHGWMSAYTLHQLELNADKFRDYTEFLKYLNTSPNMVPALYIDILFELLIDFVSGKLAEMEEHNNESTFYSLLKIINNSRSARLQIGNAFLKARDRFIRSGESYGFHQLLSDPLVNIIWLADNSDKTIWYANHVLRQLEKQIGKKARGVFYILDPQNLFDRGDNDESDYTSVAWRI